MRKRRILQLLVLVVGILGISCYAWARWSHRPYLAVLQRESVALGSQDCQLLSYQIEGRGNDEVRLRLLLFKAGEMTELSSFGAAHRPELVTSRLPAIALPLQEDWSSTVHLLFETEKEKLLIKGTFALGGTGYSISGEVPLRADERKTFWSWENVPRLERGKEILITTMAWGPRRSILTLDDARLQSKNENATLLILTVEWN